MTLSSGIIKKIFELRDANQSIRIIAKKLKIGEATVHRYIKKGREVALSRKSRPRRKKKTIGRREAVETATQKTKRFDEDVHTGSQMLDMIIAEVTQSIERPAIVRMVGDHLTDSDSGMNQLAEALDLANVGTNNKQFILRNWANYAGVKNVEKYFGVEKKKNSKEAIQDFFEELHEDELKYLRRQQRHEELVDLRKQSEEAQDKVPLVVDGVMLHVSPQVASDWRQHEAQRQRDMELEENQDKVAVVVDGILLNVTEKEAADWQQHKKEQKQKEKEREKCRESYEYRGEEQEELERIEEIDKAYIQNENGRKAE